MSFTAHYNWFYVFQRKNIGCIDDWYIIIYEVWDDVINNKTSILNGHSLLTNNAKQSLEQFDDTGTILFM